MDHPRLEGRGAGERRPRTRPRAVDRPAGHPDAGRRRADLDRPALFHHRAPRHQPVGRQRHRLRPRERAGRPGRIDYRLLRWPPPARRCSRPARRWRASATTSFTTAAGTAASSRRSTATTSSSSTPTGAPAPRRSPRWSAASGPGSTASPATPTTSSCSATSRWAKTCAPSATSRPPRRGTARGPAYWDPAGEQLLYEQQGMASYYLDEKTGPDEQPGPDGLPDRNGTWGSCFVNPGDPEWRAFLVGQRRAHRRALQRPPAARRDGLPGPAARHARGGRPLARLRLHRRGDVPGHRQPARELPGVGAAAQPGACSSSSPSSRCSTAGTHAS